MRIDLKALGEELAAAVKGQVGALVRRIEALESRQPGPGEKGMDGRDGAPGEKGADGRDGIDGRDGEPGEKGADGRDGIDGRDGADGAPGERGPQGERGLDGAPGRDGVDGADGTPGLAGKDGAPGERGEKGERGAQGEKGADGLSVTLDQVMPLLEAGVTKWMLDWERRAQDTLAKAIERMPAPKDGVDGKDGRDAFELKDFGAELSGRTLTLRFVAGEQTVERQVQIDGLPRYVGTFASGKAHDGGDMVTYGGSVWMARRTTATSPPGDDWQLVVKGTR